MAYCLYLRKSRTDIEAEAHGEGETLARHEKLLLEVAHRSCYNVTQIYKEIVSGETLAARPIMQHLLSEVEQGLWDGVLVVEVERLARGDTIDQGIVAQAFKYSNTKIITPTKIYDPNNEFDEEYFEFGLFMSRREYKTINRRLQRGRIAASKEGKHVSGNAPFGYHKVKLQNCKGWTLEIVPDEASIVCMIFNMYVTPEDIGDGIFRHIGISVIAKRLDAMGIPSPTGRNEWSTNTIHRMLQNPVYIGKIRFGHKKTKKIIANNSLVIKRYIPNKDEIIVDGLHPPIISPELFEKAAEVMHSHPTHLKYNNELINPFSGLMICKICGRTMVVATNSGIARIKCGSRNCRNNTTQLNIVESRVLECLRDWLNNYKLDPQIKNNLESRVKLAQNFVIQSEKKLTKLKNMLTRTHELLEQGIYDTDTFLNRSRELSEQISITEENLTDSREKLEIELLRESNESNIVPKVIRLLDIYNSLPNAQAKNDILKEVLEKIEYYREKRSSKKVPLDAFEITIFPKLPKLN